MSTINAAVDGIVLTAGSSTTLSLQVGGVNAIQAQSNNVTISAGGTVAAAFNSNGLFFRNRVINGDMRIDQRNAGAAVTINSTGNTYTIDRWFASGQLTDGVFTVQQDTTVPAGFTNSTKITVTTADASIGATQTYLFSQSIEGNNIADLSFGTANARTVTASFWVRSSLTGTFGGVLSNGANNRSYPFTYSISVADTWEYKTVTIPGDTTGTWLTDTGRGINIRFQIGVGSDFLGTAGAWTGTSSIFGATGATNIISTLNATWYITGVQLETGSVATPFERRPYGTELMLCQRYYYRNFPNAGGKLLSTGGVCFSTTSSANFIPFPVPMRVAPSALEQSGTAAHYAVWDIAGIQVNGSAVPAYSSTTTNVMAIVNLTVASGLTQGAATAMTVVNVAAYLGWSAEL